MCIIKTPKRHYGAMSSINIPNFINVSVIVFVLWPHNQTFFPLKYYKINRLPNDLRHSVFTYILNYRISSFLEQSGSIGDEKNWFQRGIFHIRSPFCLNCVLDIYLYRKQRLYCAFIGYRKAFHLVDRRYCGWNLLKLVLLGLSRLQNFVND